MTLMSTWKKYLSNGDVMIRYIFIALIVILSGFTFFSGPAAFSAGGPKIQHQKEKAPVVKKNSPLPVDVSRLLVDSDAAYSKGQYKNAMESLRQILHQVADKDVLWPRYKQAVLARAGDTYLRGIPKNRYQINMPAFVCGLKNRADDYFLLDVREKEEFNSNHIRGAINIPFREVGNHLARLPKPETGKKVVIICQTQHRANHVLAVLRELGFSNAYTLRNGYKSYLSYREKLRAGTLKKSPCATDNSTGVDTTPIKKTVKTSPEPVVHDVVHGAADQALQAGRYDLAVDLLKIALIKKGGKDSRWHQYDQALLEQAGSQYLRSVPDNRYRISIDQFIKHFQKKDQRYFLVDVRSPVEFTRGHLTGSVNIPFRTLLQHLGQLPKKDASTHILLICGSQRRSIYNLVLLRELGYINSFMLRGGYDGYSKWLKKLPSLQGTSLPSLQGGPSPDGQESEEEDFGC